ncbi:hypothetical protein JCM14722_09510 [Pseudodesulfovibrio portus]|uniref:Uncharacterized protein n=1 Tax=Pseudodesulfovibrio portus TaxID=231439 RepID=A0ABM8APX1_9BACT|nr:hypothetical protein JCM14722_09510 [Pseudodesulfovibrio portus]
MPGKDRHIRIAGDAFHPLELIVDQRLEGDDAEYADSLGLCSQDIAYCRKKRRLGFSSCCRGGNDDIPIAIENGTYRLFLDIPKAGPPLLPYPSLNGRVKECEAPRF